MELFPVQPDLSLQISPPNPKTSTVRRRDGDVNLEYWRIHLDSHNSTATVSPSNISSILEVSWTNPKALDTSGYIPHRHHHPDKGYHPEFDYLRPIRGIPVYRNVPPLTSPHHPLDSSSTSTLTTTSTSSLHFHNYGSRSQLLPKLPAKRSSRAPRMKWTTHLHARFTRAVQLLGGHERATPKSVLELMDTKDLTLAHVKSHLQMYRTIKTADKPAVSSEIDIVEDNSEDNIVNLQRSGEAALPLKRKKPATEQDEDSCELWSDLPSCRGAPMENPRDIKRSTTLSEEIVNLERLVPSDVMKSPPSISGMIPQRPNLEFTLGRSS